MIENAARALLAAHGGDVAVVPKWDGDDFDSIYVVTINRSGDTTKTSFALKHQGLDGQRDTCPQRRQELSTERLIRGRGVWPFCGSRSTQKRCTNNCRDFRKHATDYVGTWTS